MPIYLRITVNGKRAEPTSGRECLLTNWNSTSGKQRGTKEEAKSFNAYPNNLQSQVYEVHKVLTEAGSLVTTETLKNRLLGKSEKPGCLLKSLKTTIEKQIFSQ